MKTPRLILSTLAALAVLLASACAPAAPSSQPAVDAPASATPVSQPEVTVTSEVTVTLDATSTQAALPVATSRGPELEATDPTTVKLASGQLQLVEFFRFT